MMYVSEDRHVRAGKGVTVQDRVNAGPVKNLDLRPCKALVDQAQLSLSRRVIDADLEIARPLRLFGEWHDFRRKISSPEQYSLP